MDDSSSLNRAVASMVASARKQAAAETGARRWILLSLLAEIHRRAAVEIDALATKDKPPPSPPPGRRQ